MKNNNSANNVVSLALERQKRKEQADKLGQLFQAAKDERINFTEGESRQLIEAFETGRKGGFLLRFEACGGERSAVFRMYDKPRYADPYFVIEKKKEGLVTRYTCAITHEICRTSPKANLMICSEFNFSPFMASVRAAIQKAMEDRKTKYPPPPPGPDSPHYC